MLCEKGNMSVFVDKGDFLYWDMYVHLLVSQSALSLTPCLWYIIPGIIWRVITWRDMVLGQKLS